MTHRSAYAQIGLLDMGECLVDDIEVLAGTNGPNLVANPDFESGLANWSLQGDHCRSSLEDSGYAQRPLAAHSLPATESGRRQFLPDGIERQFAR